MDGKVLDTGFGALEGERLPLEALVLLAGGAGGELQRSTLVEAASAGEAEVAVLCLDAVEVPGGWCCYGSSGEEEDGGEHVVVVSVVIEYGLCKKWVRLLVGSDLYQMGEQLRRRGDVMQRGGGAGMRSTRE